MQSYPLVGFVMGTSELNFVEELKVLESTRKEGDIWSMEEHLELDNDGKFAKINGDFELSKGNTIMASFGQTMDSWVVMSWCDSCTCCYLEQSNWNSHNWIWMNCRWPKCMLTEIFEKRPWVRNKGAVLQCRCDQQYSISVNVLCNTSTKNMHNALFNSNNHHFSKMDLQSHGMLLSMCSNMIKIVMQQ